MNTMTPVSTPGSWCVRGLSLGWTRDVSTVTVYCRRRQARLPPPQESTMSDQTPTPEPGEISTASRESWLREAFKILREEIIKVSGIEVPDVRVSIGFGGVSYERGVAATCYHKDRDAEGVCQIFISPEGEDPVEILVSLLHEVIHAALCEAGDPRWRYHDGRFAEYAVRLGLDAPFTVTPPSPGLYDELFLLAASLGKFPHAKLTVQAPRPEPVPAPAGGGGKVVTFVSSSGNPDKNRWISYYCAEHESPVRMTRKKAARCAMVCTELDETGGMCGKPLHERVK